MPHNCADWCNFARGLSPGEFIAVFTTEDNMHNDEK